MRNTIFILVLVFFAAGCEKDLYLEGGPTNWQGYGKNNAEVGAVHLPFSASFTTLPGEYQMQLSEELSISAGGPITGNATHVGLIQEDISFWRVTDIDFDFVNTGTEELQDWVPVSIIESIKGEIHSANGDYYTYEGEAIVSLVGEPVLSGEMRFTGGTGRFEGVTGAIQLDGTADFAAGTATFKGNGVIIYPR